MSATVTRAGSATRGGEGAGRVAGQAAFGVGGGSSRPSVVCADDDSEGRGVMADSDFHLKAPG